MRVIIDGNVYHVDLQKLSLRLETWYDTNKATSDIIKLENGKTIDFSRKSVARIGFKTLMVPVLVPLIGMLYRMKGEEAPKKEKHEDLLDYAAIALIRFIALLDGNKVYVESIPSDIGNSRRVKSIATYGEERKSIAGPDGSSTQDTEKCTRGETCISGGEKWNGENVSHESVDTTEIGSATVAERLLSRHQETW